MNILNKTHLISIPLGYRNIHRYLYIYICGSATDRKTREPANCKITRGLGHLRFFSAEIQVPTSSRANEKIPLCIAAKTTGTSSHPTFCYATRSGVGSFASPLVQQHCPFCRSAVWDITTEMFQGRQAAGTPGAWPGRVPSLRSQTWGQCSPRRAAAAEAVGCWSCKDLLWG